jgi:hypothetical protein
MYLRPLLVVSALLFLTASCGSGAEPVGTSSDSGSTPAAAEDATISYLVDSPEGAADASVTYVDGSGTTITEEVPLPWELTIAGVTKGSGLSLAAEVLGPDVDLLVQCEIVEKVPDGKDQAVSNAADVSCSTEHLVGDLPPSLPDD